MVPAVGTVVPDPGASVAPGRAAAPAAAILPLYYALNYATGLPPMAINPPSGLARPRALPSAGAILSPADLAAILEEPVSPVAARRFRLGEVDERLGGLVASLDVVRTVRGKGGLIGVGVVRRDPTASRECLTIPGLWRLAWAALGRHGVRTSDPGQIGDGAFLAVYASCTQLVRMAGDRLVTVSVTRLGDEHAWTVRVARTIAVSLGTAAIRRGPGEWSPH